MALKKPAPKPNPKPGNALKSQSLKGVKVKRIIYGDPAA